MQQPKLLLEGKYEILAKIREGGMGTIYRVRHRLLDEVRVIKVMQPHVVADADLKRRFLEEAKTAIRLKHPNICTIHDFAVDDNGTAYLVMEYIDGINLADLQRSSGSPGVPLSVEIAHQALLALGYLHRKGVIHRDIAPDNLMLAHDEEGGPVVKLIDLGIAKAANRSMDMTATGVFLGKLKYASPEQYGTLAAGERLDGRSDLYGLGVVLYELLTGVRPFAGESPAELLRAHLFTPPTPFSESDPEGKVPPELRAVILKALEKKREDRYATAEEFDREIVSLRERFARPEDIERTMLQLSRIRSTQPAGPENVTPSVQDRLNRQFGPLTTPSPSAPSLKVVPGASGEKTAIDPRGAAEKSTPVPPASAPAPEAEAGRAKPGTEADAAEATRINPIIAAQRASAAEGKAGINRLAGLPGLGKAPEAGPSEPPPPARPADRPNAAPRPAAPELPPDDATKTQVVAAEKAGAQQLPKPGADKAPPVPARAQPASAGPGGAAKPKVAEPPKAPPPVVPKRPAAVESVPPAAGPRIAPEKAPLSPAEAAAKAPSIAPGAAARSKLRLWVALAAVAAALLIWRLWPAPRPAVEEVAAGPAAAPTPAAPAEAAPTPAVPSPAPTLRPTAAPTAAPTARPTRAPEASPLRQAAETARQATLSARQTSEQARARELAPSTYRRAVARQAEGERLLAQGSDREAKTALDGAARLFAQSEAAAKAAALPSPTAVRLAELPTAMPRPSPVAVVPTALPQPTAPPPTAVRLEATRAPAVAERQAAPAQPPPAPKGNPVEEQKIRDMMRSYERAWSTFDARLYARVYPSGVDAFELALKNLRSQYVRIEIQRIEVEPSGSRARVIGHETIVATPKAGNQVQNEQDVTLRVEKQGERWVITGRD